MKEAIRMKILMLMGMIVALFIGCSGEKKEEAERISQQQHNELKYAQQSRDSIESLIKSSLDEIDKRLSMIKTQQGYLVAENKRDVANKKEHILNNIAMMNELINQNLQEIDKLRNDLKQVGSKNKEIRKRIAKYEEMNKSMQAEMEDLRTQLADAKGKTEQLTVDNEKLKIEMSNQGVIYDALKTQYTKAESDAYTAYLVKGTRKELKKEKVIQKKKLLEITAPDKLNSNAPGENFEKIDTRTTLEIPVSAKDAKIVTTHSENSYKWVEDPDGTKRLCITDPQEFWQKSKYLVIETK